MLQLDRISDLIRFLLAQLHLESLSRTHNRKALRSALKALPKELNETYDESLKRIESQNSEDADLAKHVLSWISYARRPLDIEELQYAIAIVPGAKGVDEEAMTPKDLLISVCAGLVILESRSQIVRLMHSTTQEYFGQHRSHLFPDADTLIGGACLAVLQFEQFSPATMQNITVLRSPHFYHYALEYWADHIRGAAELIWDADLRRIVDSGIVSLIASTQDIGAGVDIPASPLHFAAAFGFSHFVVSLLNDPGRAVNFPSARGRTPLHLAAARGHCNVLERLLENGANCEIRDASGYTPLMVAVIEDEIDAARLLLKAGADIEVADDEGRTPLSAASWYGVKSAVRFLVKSGSALEVRDDQGLTPLSLAVQHEFYDISRILVEAGANLETRDIDGRTPLVRAIDHFDKTSAQLLIELGADLEALDDDGLTPLAVAVLNNNVSLVELLLKSGADVYRKDQDGTVVLSRIEDGWIDDPDPRIRQLLSNSYVGSAQDE